MVPKRTTHNILQYLYSTNRYLYGNFIAVSTRNTVKDNKSLQAKAVDLNNTLLIFFLMSSLALGLELLGGCNVFCYSLAR